MRLGGDFSIEQMELAWCRDCRWLSGYVVVYFGKRGVFGASPESLARGVLGIEAGFAQVETLRFVAGRGA
jgi:hypothetical protein